MSVPCLNTPNASSVSTRNSASGSQPGASTLGLKPCRPCVAWAAESSRHSFWAQVYYQHQRAKGQRHQAAVRALAFQWRRILYRRWHDRTPYDASVSLQALTSRGASLLHNLAKSCGQKRKILTASLRACVRPGPRVMCACPRVSRTPIGSPHRPGGAGRGAS